MPLTFFYAGDCHSPAEDKYHFFLSYQSASWFLDSQPPLHLLNFDLKSKKLLLCFGLHTLETKDLHSQI